MICGESLRHSEIDVMILSVHDCALNGGKNEWERAMTVDGNFQRGYA